jgi:hypothetical protein
VVRAQTFGLALQGTEGVDERVCRRLPALALGAERPFIGVLGTADALELRPGSTFVLRGLADGVFELLTEWTRHV